MGAISLFKKYVMVCHAFSKGDPHSLTGHSMTYIISHHAFQICKYVSHCIFTQTLHYWFPNIANDQNIQAAED